MAGRDFRPTRVGFTLAREPDSGEFERFFGCPVEFSGLADQFSFSNETLAIPLVTRDQHLLEALRPICEEAAKERNTAYGTLRSSVENELQKLLPHGKANMGRVAKALVDRANARAKLGERRQAAGRSIVCTSWRPIHQGAQRFARAIAWLLGHEGANLLQSCFRALDGPIGVRSAKGQSAFKRR
jgi:hypothetical protein